MLFSPNCGIINDKNYSSLAPYDYYVFKNVFEVEVLKGLNIGDSTKIIRNNGYIHLHSVKNGDGKTTYRSTITKQYNRDNSKLKCYALNLEKLGIVEENESLDPHL